MRLHPFRNAKEIEVDVLRRLGHYASRRASLFAPFRSFATHFTGSLLSKLFSLPNGSSIEEWLSLLPVESLNATCAFFNAHAKIRESEEDFNDFSCLSTLYT